MTAAAVSELRGAVDAVADRAAALDAGSTDVRADIATLGQRGLLDLGVDQMARVIEEVSAVSLSAGFSAWAQRMTIEYLQLAPPVLRDRHLADLLAGTRVGVTAMAAGLRQVAGLGAVPLTAERADGGLSISGPIRWASNVFPDSLIVLPVRADDDQSYVAAVTADAPGITINPSPPLMALTGTASTSLTLHRVRVRPDDLISTDLTGFVHRIRPTFLLLQTAFCLGVGGAALGAAQATSTGIDRHFHAEAERLRTAHRTLGEQLYAAARAPHRTALPELIRLRLDASTTAVNATRLESTLCGGAGYVLGTAANRRFREAAFLPVQSPSEGQLRWELAQYE
ncbi:acyl-CoA dehydrogenase [Mycobacterium sp. pUA109]|uniref:acyl-CoA dehydrogenase n=1 Tax=Mycobacterium sp. pUA109 TaxID=3238982 RepID=UPI00351AD693